MKNKIQYKKVGRFHLSIPEPYKIVMNYKFQCLIQLILYKMLILRVTTVIKMCRDTFILHDHKTTQS